MRAAALTAYFTVAKSVGLDWAPLLRAAGLTRAMLANTEAMIPARAVISLLETSAEKARCPTFGLRMAEARTLADMGMISVLIAHQPTLRDALGVLQSYRNRINSTLILQIEEARGTLVLREEFAIAAAAHARQSSDLALGVLARTCAAVLGSQWQPDYVAFTYPEPPPADRAIYPRLFGCRAVFEADFTGLVLDAAALDRPNPRADPARGAPPPPQREQLKGAGARPGRGSRRSSGGASARSRRRSSRAGCCCCPAAGRRWRRVRRRWA